MNLIIYSDENSAWISGQKITCNLRKAYLKLSSRVIEFKFSNNDQFKNKSVLLNLINSHQFKKIILIDSQVDLELLFSLLDETFKKTSVEYDIHVFGDFSLHINKWKKVEGFLKERSVKFICASHKQAHLLYNLVSPKTLVSVLPFCYDETEFYFSLDVRNQNRSKLGFLEQDELWLYVGRISWQKNIIPLIEIFSQYALNKPNAKLILIGIDDDLGAPIWDNNLKNGEYFQQIQQRIQNFPETLSSQIQFMGGIRSEELNSWYNSADYFISLSTYHDEDFGMAPLEAAATGLPMVLTDWGGYSSFFIKGSEEYVKLVEVGVAKENVEIKNEIALKQMEKLRSLNLGASLRLKHSEPFRNQFSIAGQVKQLEKINAERTPAFRGFTEVVNKIVLNIKMDINSFYLKKEKKLTSLYYKLYEPYYRKTKRPY